MAKKPKEHTEDPEEQHGGFQKNRRQKPKEGGRYEHENRKKHRRRHRE